MIKSLRNTSLLAPYYKWYETLSRREQTLVDVGIVVVLFVIVYAFLVQPAWNYREDNVAAHGTERAGFLWMQVHAEDVATVQASAESSAGGAKLSVVSNSARVHNITLTRLQPNTSGINIEIKTAGFNNLIEWLLKLEKNHGFRTVEARFNRLEAGNVSSQIRIQ